MIITLFCNQVTDTPGIKDLPLTKSPFEENPGKSINRNILRQIENLLLHTLCAPREV